MTYLKYRCLLGIPFAEPPLGNLRLRPPVLKTELDVKTFDASNFGKGCLQPVRLRHHIVLVQLTIIISA